MNTLFVRSTWKATALLSAFVVCLTASGTAAASRLLWVTNLGNDQGACGSTVPCRSITQAIKNAADGDSIEVGPGVYGQFSQDPTLPQSSQEQGGVLVNKSVRIFSAGGAAVTIIQLGLQIEGPAPSSCTAAAVQIVASGVTFGEPGHGFTLSGSNCIGMRVDGDNAQIGGNIATKNSQGGFVFLGNTAFIRANSANANGGDGFAMITPGTAVLGSTLLSGNSSTGNSGSGFSVAGGPTLLVSNVATGNGIGFECNTCTTFVLKDSDSIGNGGGVLLISSSGASVVVNNSFIGNSGAGIILIGTRPPGSLVFTQNNVYFNGGVEDGELCDVTNNSGQTLQAPNNYWGGGGPSGADECLTAGFNATAFQPVATSPFGGPP